MNHFLLWATEMDSRVPVPVVAIVTLLQGTELKKYHSWVHGLSPWIVPTVLITLVGAEIGIWAVTGVSLIECKLTFGDCKYEARRGTGGNFKIILICACISISWWEYYICI